MSETVFKRSLLNEPTDPDAPDLAFKHRYRRFNERWRDHMSWDLLKPIQDADEHVFQRLRVPLVDSQAEFEEQVMGLTKLIVDALNEKELLRRLPEKIDGEKGLGKLERWLTQAGYEHVERDIAYLRRLQRLGSKLSAHRKGSDYEKVLQDEQVDADPKREVALMLWDAARFLDGVAQHFLDVEESATPVR